MNTLLQSLSDIDQLDCVDINARATSYWDSSPLQAATVFLPRSSEDVSRILKACHAAGQTVIVQGGRTGCASGAVSNENNIVISLEKLQEIEDVDTVGQTVTVQAGVILENLQNAVDDEDLYLPLDLGARGSCTIGGNIATNAGGVNVIRYGMVRQLVLGLEAVLPAGQIVSSMRPMLKDNSGYDLKHLFIGTEGTLGVVTRAILRLEPKKAGHETALLALPTYDHVLNLLRRAKRQLGSELTSFELMWGDYYRAVTTGLDVRAPIDAENNFYVLLEIEARDQDKARGALSDFLEEAFSAEVIVDGVLAQSESERKEIWRIRDDFEPILRSKPVYLFDISMPMQRMETYIAEVRSHLTSLRDDAVLHVFGHIGDGNLHLFVQPGRFSEITSEETVREEVEECVYAPLRNFGGSISAEHGIGREKKAWLSVTRSQAEIALMKSLKRTIDPKNILNPGVVFDL